VFGVLGIFADTKTFSDFVDRTLVFLYKALTPHADLGWQSEKLLVATGEFIGAVLILSLIGIFVNLVLSLFANLVVQSVITEACIVAEYARSQQTMTEEMGPRASINDSFWQRLLELFFPDTLA
jgi:hypothetical protein